jgi:hypothetical protein
VADRQSTGQGAGWGDPDDGWIEVRLPRARPTIVPIDREPIPPIAPPADAALDRPASLLRISDVLSRWRAAERALAVVPQGTPDWARIQAGLIELQALHRALFEERLRSLEDGPNGSGADLPARVLERGWR